MSDKETLAQMFKKAGIQYNEDPYEDYDTSEVPTNLFQIIRDGRDNVGGYFDFVVDFIFDHEDNLKKVDIWE